MRTRRRLRISIFLRILFPLLLAMVLVHVSIVVGMRMAHRPPPGHHGPGGPGHHGPGGPGRGGPYGPPMPMPGPGPNHRGGFSWMSHRLEELLPKVTADMTPEAATKLLEDDGLWLSYEGPDRSWRTRAELPHWPELGAESVPSREVPGMEVGRRDDIVFASSPLGAGRIVLYARPPGPASVLLSGVFWTFLALQVSAILLLTWGLLVWQLRPIQWLSHGVREIASGNLRHRVPVKDSGELGLLSRGFNEMAERISVMLRAKEELLLGVSHELRGPLARLKVASEMIREPKRRAQMKRSIEEMESLVTELLESHRITSEHRSAFTRVDLGTLVLETTKRYKQGRSRLVATVEEGELTAEADRKQIERLLGNLIENALKYTSGGPISVVARADGDSVCLEVADSGPGIPPTDIVNVFEPFYRVEKSRSRETGGYGLGLYLCRKIARAHGGDVVAANRPEGGCRFTARLPRRRHESAPISSSKRAAA